MSTLNIKLKRIPMELKQIADSTKKHGITCISKDNANFSSLEATINGPNDTPYELGKFKISINVENSYPFRPPILKFSTRIFHPNIDNSGQICLDVLRMPPGGSYNPAITLESILISIQLLLASPNPDDPLNNEAADLYKKNRKDFNNKVLEYIKLYAIE